MITELTANRCLAPLWALFPKTEDEPDYQCLVIKALATSAADAAHADTIVKRLIHECHFRPVPADVFAAAEQNPPLEPLWQGTRNRQPKCSVCSDNRFVPQPDPPAVDWAGYRPSVVIPCPQCNRHRGTAA